MKKKIGVIAAAVASLTILAWAQDAFTPLPVQAGQATLLVKGEAALVDSVATVTLPSWFETQAQASGRIVILTCKDGLSPLSASAVANGRFTVTTNEHGAPNQAFYWVVLANRAQQ